MTETRVVEKVYTDGVLVEEITAEISDEQLAEEAERQAMEKAEDLIDSISNLTDAKEFLKGLVKRLINKGLLP